MKVAAEGACISMALRYTKVVDAVGIHKKTDEAVLTLVDEADWVDEQQHLRMLQDKLNAYIRFIESGELYEKYPHAKGHPLAIEVVGRHPLPAAAAEFYRRAECALVKSSVRLAYIVFLGTVRR